MKKLLQSIQPKQELKKELVRVLDFEPKVKIRKLDNGAVQVNR